MLLTSYAIDARTRRAHRGNCNGSGLECRGGVFGWQHCNGSIHRQPISVVVLDTEQQHLHVASDARLLNNVA